MICRPTRPKIMVTLMFVHNINISNNELKFKPICSRRKYLGVIIHSTMKTTKDVARQTRKFYLQANLLLRNFRHSSDDVKCVFFRLTVLISIVVSCGLSRRKVA